MIDESPTTTGLNHPIKKTDVDLVFIANTPPPLPAHIPTLREVTAFNPTRRHVKTKFVEACML
jgi:hypothetical protein